MDNKINLNLDNYKKYILLWCSNKTLTKTLYNN